MSDAVRSERPEAPDRERDARIEDLLLSGLDHYFGGDHEQAINVWTRVLFLDRGHARARAYIERARGAVAEKQREGEELLHAGAAALARGDLRAARRLLLSAVERGARSDEVSALLHRLERLHAVHGAGRPAARAPADEASPGSRQAVVPARLRVAWLGAGLLAGMLVAGAAGLYVMTTTEPPALMPDAAPAVREAPLPVPAPCEIRLARARLLAESGRPREALALLAAGDPHERHAPAVDDLRADLQRQLLAGAAQPAGGARPGTSSSTGTAAR